ncbi:MAG: SDR family NAD(P)-dependent oxidoreductase [Paenibacillus macerans]|uniref:SDR family NAD(P)-dependent oxidoreductase n=1 Tax=Paenibacillus macerans TaxID=44252 RepID=A0A6N8F0N8_PAEMA|nr:SDR family NAD(P)-dependent oxidoreductase [Paenibacillus macerans]MBS5911370.1 SDR family NAD(P)-dependent oxidoreductase [Paenibacillus macerans]MDU5946053.1 SDR family NAD(P)-dependent oxidoreductase [Paenibacillus macerans]MDU7477194.1 SDR family NAD(P)-dependent oxidoreductase [Paenibacillus macerans]MEC0139678.1 SDR family NAD(P)-dependent oxidoreductase [Paenibacillus macerans]MUG25529.1 SDR family NAD(P)-dependent oxidoreductase [Paenibacillus macerans]
MSFHNKVVLVTGGGTGIGRATSLLLGERGAAVAVNYSRSAVEAEETVREIKQAGGRAFAIRADVSRDDEVREMVEQVVRQFGTLDYLVNNASITRYIAMQDLDAVTEEIWDDLLGVNVKGMFNCARAAAPYLREGKQGAIVNVGSVAGMTGKGSSLPYAVSKAAVHGLTKSLAHALAPEIRVCGIAPGAVATRWWEGKEEQMRSLITHLPLERISPPEEIAQLICAVLEQFSLTGQIITVDNGQTM